jgi:hypothetical protein
MRITENPCRSRDAALAKNSHETLHAIPCDGAFFDPAISTNAVFEGFPPLRLSAPANLSTRSR